MRRARSHRATRWPVSDVPDPPSPPEQPEPPSPPEPPEPPASGRGGVGGRPPRSPRPPRRPPLRPVPPPPPITLAEARRRTGYTPEHLERLAGVPPGTVEAIEAGDARALEPHIAAALAAALLMDTESIAEFRSLASPQSTGQPTDAGPRPGTGEPPRA